jgi:hypothetical protein
MKATFPKAQHASYRTHRRQVVWQVILPVVLAAALLVGLVVLISLATFQGGGEVGRWAAISTIWIVLPVMAAGLIVLAVLCGIIYLIARLLQVAPNYTAIAQDFAYRVEALVQRLTRSAVKPILLLDEIGAYLKALFGRK